MNYWVLTLLLCIQYICRAYGDYYWKEYKDKIPYDAFSAEPNSNKEQVYIGQAFLYDDPYQGMYPTSIAKDEGVYVAMVGYRKADYFVQILCSDEPSRFEWLPANTTHLHLLSSHNEIIRGGIEYIDHHGDVGIGRIRIRGVPVIGKIMLEKDIGKSDMWFVHNERERLAETYDVLTYRPNILGNGTKFN